MAYSTLRTDHSVGDTIYYYSKAEDAVHRGVVTGISATCVVGGYTPSFDITYTVQAKWAADKPESDLTLESGDVFTNAEAAFPDTPPEVRQAPPRSTSADDGGPF